MDSALWPILAAVACSVVGKLTPKTGMTHVGQIGGEALGQPVGLMIRLLTSPLVVAGLGLYVLGSMAWLTVLSRVPLSLAYPTLALSYALTPILAWLVLGEDVPAIRWLGITTICLGVVLVSRS